MMTIVDDFNGCSPEEVLHSLDMTLYHIEDPMEAGDVARDLNNYWKRLADIHQGKSQVS